MESLFHAVIRRNGEVQPVYSLVKGLDDLSSIPSKGRIVLFANPFTPAWGVSRPARWRESEARSPVWTARSMKPTNIFSLFPRLYCPMRLRRGCSVKQKNDFTFIFTLRGSQIPSRVNDWFYELDGNMYFLTFTSHIFQS